VTGDRLPKHGRAPPVVSRTPNRYWSRSPTIRRTQHRPAVFSAVADAGAVGMAAATGLGRRRRGLASALDPSRKAQARSPARDRCGLGRSAAFVCRIKSRIASRPALHHVGLEPATASRRTEVAAAAAVPWQVSQFFLVGLPAPDPATRRSRPAARHEPDQRGPDERSAHVRCGRMAWEGPFVHRD